MKTLHVRCSALPRAFLCGGSIRSELLINETNDAAAMGTCAHVGLRSLVETGRVDWDGVAELAHQHNDANEAELRMLLAQGAKLWNQVKDSFPNAVTEVSLEHEWTVVVEGEEILIRLTGHTDILAGSLDTVHVGDHKTGRKDGDHSEQLKGYAVLALLRELLAKAATATVLWIRDCEAEHYTMLRAELQTWIDRFFELVVYWDGTYRPGDHCQHCPRNHECPAANALARRDFAVVANTNLGDTQTLREMVRSNPDQVVQLLGKADAAAKCAKRLREAVKSIVLEDGDIVGDGKRVTIETSHDRVVDPIAAFPVLEAAGFDDSDLAKVIKISAAKAENVVRARAPHGKGAAAARELQAALNAAGAIQLEPEQRLVTKRV